MNRTEIKGIEETLHRVGEVQLRRVSEEVTRAAQERRAALEATNPPEPAHAEEPGYGHGV